MPTVLLQLLSVIGFLVSLYQTYSSFKRTIVDILEGIGWLFSSLACMGYFLLISGYQDNAVINVVTVVATLLGSILVVIATAKSMRR